MYKTKVTQAKRDSVQSIKEKCPEGTDIILANYSGLNVNQIRALRLKLRPLDSHFHVVKNNYAKIAFKDLGYPSMDDGLTGPTALAYTNADSASLAKELFEYAKETNLDIKGGFIEGTLYNADQIEAYSALPSRLQLIAQVMSTASAPLQNFVFGLSSITTKLVRTLQAVADSKSA